MAELNSQNDDDDDDDFDHLVTHVVMYDEMVQTGLHIANFSETQILRGTEVINISRFRQNYGVLPTLCCTIYEDLQKSAAVDNSSTPPTIMRLTGSHTQFKWFLRALYYLRKYPLETDFAKDLKVSSEHYARDRIWEMITRIQYLKLTKITWPDDLGGGDVWVITVDGTHVWLKEPTHAEFSQDSKYWSHKFNKAGFNYELGIAVASQKLVWMNGPFKAGRSDKQIFVENGLKQKLLQLGKKCIGDGAYNGHLDVASYPNYHDSYSVKKFKSRALKRHEAFNGMTKNFKILDVRFRNSLDKIAPAFEAVCVICQYKIETDEPLYDVLIDDVVNGGDESDSDSDDGFVIE
jgi:hypothetical protein